MQEKLENNEFASDHTEFRWIGPEIQFSESFATLKYYTFFYSCLACLGRFGQHEQLMTQGGKQIAAGRCYNAERELEKHNVVMLFVYAPAKEEIH